MELLVKQIIILENRERYKGTSTMNEACQMTETHIQANCWYYFKPRNQYIISCIQTDFILIYFLKPSQVL